jgi:hypothetical protein
MLDLPTRSEISSLTQRLKSIEAQMRTARASDAARKKPKPRAATGKARHGRRKSKS